MRVSQIVGKRTIDLNVDIGEGFPHDAELLRFASSANVCCGVHAGSRDLTLSTIELCRKHRVRLGIHPGYPDRPTMGRAPMQAGQERPYLKSLFEQVTWFLENERPDYLKPHGAFYNDTAVVLPHDWKTQRKRAPTTSEYESGGVYLSQFPGLQSLLMLLRIHKLPLMGLEKTAHKAVADRARQPFIREGFADRQYRRDGTLMPRSEPGAVLVDPGQVREQVLQLASNVDSICLHGDTPDCLPFAELVYRTLLDGGYGVGA
ncbi:LamB/YcsF family protein [Fimbriimonas ginsengisoli]|uniref:Lactam utilization protein LamB n=1 Tax=Fimbriimonas ginsengisoli Gsoil 348 TaxID=661478 RepID=A0A068NQ04_FIMGI|nr:LamB/YcsF family protein [Fimbriimonas ginsengisoli]AIE85452.1 Lactam utilization protein LamB [Fimbriimonas ginsengisoli Gsoil 348]